jgi:hypothetical protein
MYKAIIKNDSLILFEPMGAVNTKDMSRLVFELQGVSR